jgi:hypothetical protein
MEMVVRVCGFSAATVERVATAVMEEQDRAARAV